MSRYRPDWELSAAELISRREDEQMARDFAEANAKAPPIIYGQPPPPAPEPEPLPPNVIPINRERK